MLFLSQQDSIRREVGYLEWGTGF